MFSLVHSDTGLPSFGRTRISLNGELSQSHGSRITAAMRRRPSACSCSARWNSFS